MASLDRVFALARLHYVFDWAVILQGAELTNDLFDAVAYPRLTDAVGRGLLQSDFKNWTAVITELIQHAYDNSAVSLAGSAVLAAFSYCKPLVWELMAESIASSAS